MASENPTQPMNPMQPIVIDGGDPPTPRFKMNAIVRALLNHGRRTGLDLDGIADMEFTPDDRCQFAQLIGYSLPGYLELSYVAGRHAADAEAAMAAARGQPRRVALPDGDGPDMVPDA